MAKEEKDELIEQDLSMLNLPEERVFKIGNVEKIVKIWPLSYKDSFLFAKIYSEIISNPDKINIDKIGDDLRDLIARSLRVKKSDIDNAPISFITWCIKQILEVSDIDFFIQNLQEIQQTILEAERKAGLLDFSQASSEDFQEKKDGQLSIS